MAVEEDQNDIQRKSKRIRTNRVVHASEALWNTSGNDAVGVSARTSTLLFDGGIGGSIFGEDKVDDVAEGVHLRG